MQFQDQNNFYFNDISCIDTTHCFAVGEGFTDGDAPVRSRALPRTSVCLLAPNAAPLPTQGARIYGTTDGKTWSLLLFSKATGASLMRVHTVSRTEAWAAGGEVDNSASACGGA